MTQAQRRAHHSQPAARAAASGVPNSRSTARKRGADGVARTRPVASVYLRELTRRARSPAARTAARTVLPPRSCFSAGARARSPEATAPHGAQRKAGSEAGGGAAMVEAFTERSGVPVSATDADSGRRTRRPATFAVLR